MSQSGVYKTSGSSPTTVETLTGNTGGAVGPTGNNINVVGDGATIEITGNPGTSTLTVSVTQEFAATYTTDDSNFAVPTLYNLNIFGGSGITTSSSGDTVTISATGITTLAYRAVSTTPYVVVAGDAFLGVDCSAGAITIELPNTVATGRVFVIKDSTGNAQTHNITVTTVGGLVNIDGATSFVMNTQYESVNALFDGTTYQIY